MENTNGKYLNTEKYTMSKAINEVLSNYPVGSEFAGIEFCDACRAKFAEHGRYEYHLDNSWFTQFREVRDSFYIICINKIKSIYKKYTPEEFYQKKVEEILNN